MPDDFHDFLGPDDDAHHGSHASDSLLGPIRRPRHKPHALSACTAAAAGTMLAGPMSAPPMLAMGAFSSSGGGHVSGAGPGSAPPTGSAAAFFPLLAGAPGTPPPSLHVAKLKRERLANELALLQNGFFPPGASNGADGDTPEAKRTFLNVLERARREDLKASFVVLRECIPDLELNKRAAKGLILKKAGAYIAELQKEEAYLEVCALFLYIHILLILFLSFVCLYSTNWSCYVTRTAVCCS